MSQEKIAEVTQQRDHTIELARAKIEKKRNDIAELRQELEELHAAKEQADALNKAHRVPAVSLTPSSVSMSGKVGPPKGVRGRVFARRVPLLTLCTKGKESGVIREKSERSFGTG